LVDDRRRTAVEDRALETRACHGATIDLADDPPTRQTKRKPTHGGVRWQGERVGEDEGLIVGVGEALLEDDASEAAAGVGDEARALEEQHPTVSRHENTTARGV
jgi:hypothetical protein